MLFSTSLVALVGTEDHPVFNSKKLQIVNTKRDSLICELTFPSSILGVKMNRRRLVVVLLDHIYVYEVSNMKLLHTIETSINSKALCALSSSNENSYLIYPAPTAQDSSPFSSPIPHTNLVKSIVSGDALIFDALSLQVVNIVQAHKSSLNTIVLNSTGTMLATASDKGTVIRIFSVPEAHKIYQFRRGTYSARIYSISFNISSTLLCVSSETETIHIFNLNKLKNLNKIQRPGSSIIDTQNSKNLDQKVTHKQHNSFHGFIGQKIYSNIGNYIPGKITEIWEPERDFAFLKLMSPLIKNIVALSNTGPQVMVICSDGYYYEYNIDLENGGECTLSRQFNLLSTKGNVENS